MVYVLQERIVDFLNQFHVLYVVCQGFLFFLGFFKGCLYVRRNFLIYGIGLFLYVVLVIDDYYFFGLFCNRFFRLFVYFWSDRFLNGPSF